MTVYMLLGSHIPFHDGLVCDVHSQNLRSNPWPPDPEDILLFGCIFGDLNIGLHRLANDETEACMGFCFLLVFFFFFSCCHHRYFGPMISSLYLYRLDKMATMKLLALFQNVQSILISLPFIGRPIDVFLATLPLVFRFASGAFAAGNINLCNRPRKRLVLYEYEGCPFCRKVRECLSVLCLEVEIRPTPRETLAQYGFCDKSRFRPEVKNHPKGGHLRFPFLVDEGNNEAMYDSDVIIDYLWKNYGNKATIPWTYWLATLPVLKYGSFLSCLPRLAPQFGFLRVPSYKNKQPLELWSFEASPFCRIVREVLCILELPYILHNIPHYAEGEREEFALKFNQQMKEETIDGPIRYAAGFGKFPWLYDPNTEVSMGESSDIVTYLYKQYKAGEMDVKSGDLSNYSTKGASQDHGTIYGGKND